MNLALNSQGRFSSTGETDVALERQKVKLPLPIILYFIALLFPVHFNVGTLHLTSVRALLLVLFIPLAFNFLKGKYGKLIWTDIFFFLHLLWVGVALAVNSPDKLVSQVGSLGIEFLGGYILARAYIRGKSDMVAVIKIMLLIVLLTLPLAFYETLTGHPVIIEMIRKIPGIVSEPIASMPKRWGLERVQVMMAHPIHYGLFTSIQFSLVFVGLKGVIGDRERYLATLAILLCVVFSLSSGALLSITLQAILIFWATALNNVKYRWIIFIIVLLVMYVTVDLLSNRTPIRVFMHYATFSAHNAYWRGIIFEWGMINVWANPIFGLGFKDWVRPHYMYSGSMDNFWLVMAVRYGIPGFALLAIGYIIALWRIARRDFDDDQLLWQLRRAWMFTFLGLTFTICTVHIWASVYSVTFFIFGAGIWLIAPGTDQKESAPASTSEIEHGSELTIGRTSGMGQLSGMRNPGFPNNFSPSASAKNATTRRTVRPIYSRFSSPSTKSKE